MLNKRKTRCPVIPNDQQNQCKESGTTTTTISSSSLSSTTTPSTNPLPPPLLATSSSSPPQSPLSRPNGSQATEIEGNMPETVSMVIGESTSISSPSSTSDNDKNQKQQTPCFNNSNNENMTSNIEKIINCRSEKLSVNLLSSRTFNKLTPNVFNLRPRISTHRKHHHHHSHFSSSLNQHKRTELGRLNQNKGNDDSEGEGTTNCYTSSSEHSMDTVIFCGKSMRSPSSNANNQNHHHSNHIPSSPKSSSSPGKPKVPITANGSPKATATATTLEPRLTPMCQPMMVIAKSSNCSTSLNMIQQQQQLQQSSPKRYSSSSSNTNSSSPLVNQLTIDSTINCVSTKQHSTPNHASDKKVHIKKLGCDIGTSPLHKISLNCKTNCPPNCYQINRKDELWIDKPKKSKRRKPPHRISGVELWVDGPNAIPVNSISTNESTNCEYSDKHLRTTEWINQHAKTIFKGNNLCSGQHRTSSANCNKTGQDSINPVTSKSLKSNSSNGANGLDLNNPASPYHVGVSELTIKEKHAIDKLIETKEMACQTESNEILIVSDSVNCTNNSDKIEELNTEETLILLSNLHDNHEGNYEDEVDDINDWTDERRLMLLERGALSDCCDNRVCCCSSSFTSEDDEDPVSVDHHLQEGESKLIDQNETIESKIVIQDGIESTKENNLDSVTKQNSDKLNNSNDLTEPPGQLKLEQFLKQLITVTNPVLNDNENVNKIKKDKNHHRHRSHHDHHGHTHHHSGERKLSQPINHYNNYPQYDSLPPRRLTRSRFNGTKYYDSFGSHQDLTNCSVDENQLNGLKSTGEDSNCKPVNYIIANELPINDDCCKNHVTLLPTSPRINRILGGAQTKVECINLTNSPTKSSRKQSFNKRDTTSTTTSGHGTTSEGDDRSIVTKKSSDSSSSPSQSHDRTFNSSSSSASQYRHHHHHHYHHRSGQTSSGGPSSSGYDSTIKDEESDRELIIIDNQPDDINGKKLMASDEDNTCNGVAVSANNNGTNNTDSANNSNDISNSGNNSNNTNLQGSCNIVKSSVKMRDKSEKQNRKNKKDKDKDKDKRESLSSEKCSFLCCKLTSFY